MDTALWVFGYGSLMWDTGFPVAESHVARLTGWQRSFCMWSVHYRGTEVEPGLVLALDRDAAAFCDGLAFRVEAGQEAAVLQTLRERELISYAYREERLPVTLRDGRQVTALAYVINREHGQYGGGLSLEEQARIIAVRGGVRGPNRDYLWNTVDHLAALGIGDGDLDWLAARVRELAEGS
jgi:glutathione-specific gamma-glutamylcyclotransferase